MNRRELLQLAGALALASCGAPAAVEVDQRQRVTEDEQVRLSERDAEPRDVEQTWE